MQEIEFFFMGPYNAYVSLEAGRSTLEDEDKDDLQSVNVRFLNGERIKDEQKEWMTPSLQVMEKELRIRLANAERIFLNGTDYLAYLDKIKADGCLDVIKNKRVVIMLGMKMAPEAVVASRMREVESRFGLTDVKFIPSTREAFQGEVNSASGIVRDASPAKIEPLARPNPNAVLAATLSPSPAKERAAPVISKDKEEATEKPITKTKVAQDNEVDEFEGRIVPPVPPLQPVSETVPPKVVPQETEIIKVAFFVDPSVGQPEVMLHALAQESTLKGRRVVIEGKLFALDGRMPAAGENHDAICLMWDASIPTTLFPVLEFASLNFKDVPLVFIALNAENVPAHPVSSGGNWDGLLDQPVSLAEQKENIQIFVETNRIQHHEIMDGAKISELKAKIVEFANLIKISFADEIKIKFGMFHTRKVRTDHLTAIFEKENLEPADIQWLLLHKASVKPKGQTARLIEDRLGNRAENFISPREVSPAVPELLSFLDTHERLIFPRVVMFFTREAFATDYITGNYDEKRKAILDVAEKLFRDGPDAFTHETLFGNDKSKIPPEVIAIVEKYHESLKIPVAVERREFTV